MADSMFEKTFAWQKSRNLVKEVYGKFRLLKDFAFRDQILRCTISIMNNVAEGMERSSQKELRQFLTYAKGSCGELQSMLTAAFDIDYIDETTYEKMLSLAKEQSKILHGFIKSVDKAKRSAS